MGTPFQENYFDFDAWENLRLIFCGNRFRSYGHHYGPYKLSTYLLCYVEEGQALFHFGEKTVTVQEDTFYVIYPHSGVWYESSPDVPWTIHWVVANGPQLEKILSKLHFSPEEPCLPVRQTERIRMIYRNLFQRSCSEGLADKMTCLSLLYELFSLLAEDRANSGENIHIRRAMDYISVHYTGNITVPEIARHLHLSSNYFTKLFKQETGMTPVQYIASLRYEKAAYLLCYTDMSIAEIASAVGFSDTLYFSRFFREFAGRSPSAYRKANRS